MISVQASFKKEIYPIFGKVLCRTFKLIILFKTHFYYVLFCNSVLMGNLTEREISVRCLGLVVFLSTIRGASEGEQCLLELRPSASSVPLPRAGKKGDGTYARWLPLSHIDLGSEKAIYLPSRGKTGVSELQGSQQRCANATAIDTIKPRAAICSGGKMQAIHAWALHQVTVTQNRREAEDLLAAGCCLPGMSSVMFIAGVPTLQGKSWARAAFKHQTL